MKAISSRKTSNKRTIIAVASIVLAVLILGFGVRAYLQSEQQKTLEQQKTQQPSQSAKNDVINGSKDSSTPSGGLPGDSTTTTTDQVPTSSNLSVSITATSQSEGLVRASSQTSGGGTCVFLYQPADGGKPVTRQVEVASNSCSVAISQNEFAYLGQWKLTATYYANDSKAEVSQNVTIR